MLKANSLNYILPATQISSSSHPNPLHNNKNIYTIVHDNQGHLLRNYQLTLAEFSKDSQLFEWRKKIHHPIPKIILIKQQHDSIQRPFVSVLCEHINVSFTDLRPLKLEELMYCLSEMILGYQEIFNRLGFVCVQQKFMGLNTRGQLLLWIGQNLLGHVGQGAKLLSQKQIVLRAIQLLQTKNNDINSVFFTELRKVEPKFRNVLDFIMGFKTKYQLKIIPKIVIEPSQKSLNQKMLSSNTFSNRTQQPVTNNHFTSERDALNMKRSGQIKNCQSESQFLASSKSLSNQCSMVRNNLPTTRTSIMQSNINNTPTNNNMLSSINQKSAPKVSFSYSQKRQQINTPKHSLLPRDYTSDRNLPLLHKLNTSTNQIKEFTLEDKRQKSVSQQPEKTRKKPRNNLRKKIVQTYAISYTPSTGKIAIQTELDLKKSTMSMISQCSLRSQDKLFSQEFCQNKTSMTTNHRSAVTQSFQSLGKSSNDDESYNRKNELFTSNNSHRTTYSIIKSSFVENEHGKNAVSFVVGHSQQSNPPSPLNQHSFRAGLNNFIQSNQKRKDMYTFGGLMSPLLDQSHDLKHSTNLAQHQQQPINQTNPLQSRPSLVNQINTKSIDQLYNNLYFNSQKKSMIMDEAHYSIKLSPVKEELHSHVKDSFAIDLSEVKGHQPLSHTKKSSTDRSHNEYMTPKIGEAIAFDYNQWRGIKGLLNESNVYELKESIHCGPDIRSPVNIKLQLLDKFGRQIGQSILPSTPSGGHHSRAHSIYTINTEEHSIEYC